jgi:putative transposase
VVPGYPHHLILRGNNRRRLFSRDVERRLFLALVCDAIERTGVKLHALALMSNHVHELASPPDERALAAFVKWFAQAYAARRNRAKGGSGKLFEARFKSKLVLDDAGLAIETAYIETNSVRAGLVKDPMLDPWSTYPIHAGQPERSAFPVEYWTPSPWYLGLAETPHERARLYRDFVAAYLAHRMGQPRRAGSDLPERRPDGTRAT